MERGGAYPSRLIIVCASLFLLAAPGFAQDRGSITGAVSDGTGAVIPGVSIVATNRQTNARYETFSTETGNYSIVQLPPGVYEIAVELPGFRKYVRQGVTVLVAQTLRIDVELEVGANTEEVTVTADASLLRTETSELSSNITATQMNELPILGIGAGAAGAHGIRNPLNVTILIPGSYYVPGTVSINGLGSPLIRIDGQEATARIATLAQSEPSVDALQEVAVQTSNYAAEFGQAGGGIFNYVLRSGSNQWHGSAFEILSDTHLNAREPFATTRSKIQAHDFGVSVGGPIIRDKTFFFFNHEQFLQYQTINSTQNTVPTSAYRNGDFSAVLTGRTLGTDPIGRPIMEGAIYDPATTRLAPDGRVIRDPFPNNQIPPNRMDAVAMKIQALIPPPDAEGLVNNQRPSWPSNRNTNIPSVKIDHNLSVRTKISGSWQRTSTFVPRAPGAAAGDGLPLTITRGVRTDTVANVARLSLDHNFSGTLLLHLGAGWLRNWHKADPNVDDFDQVAELGLRGAPGNGRFPTINGLSAARGGMKDFGPDADGRTVENKPTANANLSWIRNNHTYKSGGEMVIEGMNGIRSFGANGIYGFSANQTALPYAQSSTISGGTVGFPYASFLLGLVNNGDVSNRANVRLGKSQWGFYAQDTWKATRTFTLDYGLRWDYMTYLKEHHGRAPQFSPTTANPSAGGILGASIFEGDGPGRCGCNYGENYKLAFGPRLGMAWQVTPGWVARIGVGLTYSGTSDFRSIDFGNTNPFGTSAFGDAAMRLQDGVPQSVLALAFWPKYDPGMTPLNGNPAGGGAPTSFDRNAGRPGRIFQYSAGVQREIARDLVVEASYVGNRAAWLDAPALRGVNTLTAGRLAASGLSLNNAADRALLRSRLDSSTAAARGFNRPPYANFPLSQTVAQSLRPFPQFGNISSQYAPLGASWYDSLQAKATKRLSYGLDFSSTFTWSKEINRVVVNDVFNTSDNRTVAGRPLLFVVAANYQIPRWELNKFVSNVLGGWTFGTVIRLGSGAPLPVPTAQSQLGQLLLGQTTNAIRVPGEPLFTKDLNCNCFDPNTEFVLNPKAWVDPPDGQFSSTGNTFDDYREQRRPREAMSLARQFRIRGLREGATLSVRLEFENVFNRTYLPNPSTGNALQTQTKDVNGKTVSGFGRINTGAAASTGFLPRQGQLVARFRF
jgi:hypothetical protein